jgi:DNA repair exonuclease SbcCD ATPase subunit
MKFLKRDKVSELTTVDELIRTYTHSDIRATSDASDDIALAHDAVTELSYQFKSSADAQQAAAKRMSALTKTITKMETRLRQLDRVETDNQKLAKELQDLSQKYKQKSLLSEEQEKTLSDLRRQRDDFRTEAETTKKSLVQFEERDAASREALLKQSRELETFKTKLLQKEERVQTLELTQQNLKEDLAQSAAEISSERHRSLELQKSTEELASRLTEKTQISDKAMNELKAVQIRFNEQKEKLFALKGEVQSLTYNLTSHKSGYEDTLKRREDEILSLKNQNEQLNTQLKIKDNMAAHFDEELSGLRVALDAERSRATRESNALHNKSEELDRHNQALAKSKAEYEQLQAKFSTAVEDLDTLRKLCSIQKQKLERYAAISGGATGQVFVHQGESPSENDYSPRLKAV